MRKTLRQAWKLDDAEKAEKLIRNLARRLEREVPGVSASIDEILTDTRLGLPVELRRSLACTNIIENINGVKRWRDARTALRWTGAAMLEAAKGSAQSPQATADPAGGAGGASSQERH